MRARMTLEMGVLLAAAITTAAASPMYVFTNFDGPNGGAGTVVNGINNNGAAVGVSTDAMGNATNFIRNPDGTFTTLSLPGTAPMANGINSQNDVVGTTGTNAFLLHNGNVSQLPPANPGNTGTEVAFGINDQGTIVGQFGDNLTGTVPGFVYANGAYTVLTPVAPVNGVLVVNAQGVNNKGLVTGFYSTADTPVIDGNTPQHGFLYDSTTHTYSLLADPNQPNFFLAQFLGINDHNEAAGYWQDTAGDQHGFLYDIATGKYTFLDDPSQAVNNGITITQITGIDNAGAIGGFYVGADGLQHGFVASAVPEPASLGLAGLGLVCVGLCRNSKRRRNTGQ